MDSPDRDYADVGGVVAAQGCDGGCEVGIIRRRREATLLLRDPSRPADAAARALRPDTANISRNAAVQGFPSVFRIAASCHDNRGPCVDVTRRASQGSG